MDIVCFSHLRWDFVFQRPQHLLTRLADKYRIFYVEEPIYGASQHRNEVHYRNNNVAVVVPHIAAEPGSEQAMDVQKELLADLWRDFTIRDFGFWYYTPMALPVTRHMYPRFTVYDCMDELANFRFAPPELTTLEQELFERADVVFTGGHSLYGAKKDKHHNIHPFPSSIDKAHFHKARSIAEEPADQAGIAKPRFGFYGVIDERFDINLLDAVSKAKPDWQFVLIGPVVKIDPATLPQRENIHYLGQKSYQELPAYLSGWQVAMIPFELNESTRFISPTKTPEYLAAGVPVISTAIEDVVKPYGESGLVHIATDAATFIRAGEKILNDNQRNEWLAQVDEFLQDNCWDKTCNDMRYLIQSHLTSVSHQKKVQYV